MSDTEIERFSKHFIPEPNSGCWLWEGALGGAPIAYGSFRLGRRGSKRAHRIAWQLFRGPIPEGLCVLHKCDMPLCVNPEHLFLGTRDDNNKDMMQKGRVQRGASHYKAKLSLMDVLQIRSERASGATIHSIACRHKVADGTVTAILYGKSWRSA